MLPMVWGCVAGVMHDHKRRETTTLFAALDVLDGAVLATPHWPRASRSSRG
jgi:putative transposase